MKEIRLTQQDLLDIPADPVYGKFYLRIRLKREGFDLDKEITFHEDFVKQEYVYTQKD